MANSFITITGKKNTWCFLDEDSNKCNFKMIQIPLTLLEFFPYISQGQRKAIKSSSPPFVPPPGKTSKRTFAWEVGHFM